MNDAPTNDEVCVVCAKHTDEANVTAHLYHEGRRFAVCCPMCLEMFQRAPARFASGEHRQTLIEETIEKMKWGNA